MSDTDPPAESGGSRRLSIELHPEQIAAVQRHLKGGAVELWDIISGAATDPVHLPPLASLLKGRRISHSFVRGMWLLLRLSRFDDWATVNDVAEGTGMSPSSVHRYLTTFLAFGLAEQQYHSRRYRIRRTAADRTDTVD
jgi:hypothetical protein